VRNTDLGELAARMCAGLDGVRACLLLSPDGLTLGAYPSNGEELGREVWDRLEQTAAPQRGFLDLGDEVWVIAKRGPYTAVLVSAPALRPGLLLDRVEALLRAAEETRAQGQEADRPPSSPPKAEKRRPRPPLHKIAESAKPAEEPLPDSDETTPPQYEMSDQLASAAGNVVDVAKLESEDADAAGGPEAGGGETPASGNGNEIDRVALAREFGRLIADGEGEEQ
jgi:hypothetical protein